MTSVGLIGYGGIAQDAVAAVRDAGGGVKFAGVLCRPGRVAKARAALGDIVETLDDLLARGLASWPKSPGSRRSRSTARKFCGAASICW